VPFRREIRSNLFRLLILASWVLVCRVHAGGSGLNTLVVINQSSANSRELGNYYCERRQVPPNNVLRIAWNGVNTFWSRSDFQSYLLEPLMMALTARGLTNQIDYVVLSMDIPFQTVDGSAINSTTSALFYGFKDDSGPDWVGITNSYAASEQVFAQAKPASAPGYAFLTTMITSDTLAHAKMLVDQGVNSDGTFPYQSVLLAKSSDATRNIRYHAFDNAVFNGRLNPYYSIARTNCDGFFGQTNLLGFQTGLYQFSVSPNAFVPGAMADSLSSYGGLIFGYNDQTTLLTFINAGAAGSYGTVTEPSPNPEKFPDPQNYFYQARGFSLAECYYQSLLDPYEGLIVGEPLAAPCQRLASARWLSPGSNSVLSGVSQLSARFSSRDLQRPLQQIDLFVDGKFFQTMTNLSPRPGNVLSVSLNGYPISYVVPANSTIATVATGLAAVLNASANSNATRTVAFVHGDRIELRSTSTNRFGDPLYFLDMTATNSAPRFYRTVDLAGPNAPMLSGWGREPGGIFRMHIDADPGLPYTIQSSTNLAQWFALGTNFFGGPMDFIDVSATNIAHRFYRVFVWPHLPSTTVSIVGSPTNGSSLLRIDGAIRPFVIQYSTDLFHWSTLGTNLAVGQIAIAAAASQGAASSLSTFVTASRSTFLDSAAYGIRSYNVNGTLQPGVYLQVDIVKINGAQIHLAVTNQSSSSTILAFTTLLVAAINSSPELMASDGLVAEDLMPGWFGSGQFNLRARAPGDLAASIQVHVSGSESLVINPDGNLSLQGNLSDLQPRNHLYLSAGTTNLTLAFPLDTRVLADGFHELAAVAYEGSHVRTQTRLTTPVIIKNSPLTATLSSLDMPDTAPVGGTYHIQVVANTNNVSAIRLLSTGGVLDTVTNQATANFTINGSSLGVGRHPFYGLIETTSGLSYRTQTRWVRLQ
jgi:uncharacterized protein (TIGR03790 family)